MFMCALYRNTATGVAVFALIVGGCGGPRKAAPVDPGLARQTLQTVLNNWQSGQTPEAQQQRTPKVVVQDVDWMGDSQLIDYKVLGDGEPRDANLHVKVELTLRNPEGKERKKKAFYVVGTDPILTVFRELPL